MGLLTDSKPLREKMLTRNIYSAEHMYGLDNDILTKTLDTFAKLGMDLRTSTLLAGAERLIDNTQLSLIGLERLAVEIGRRTANNIFRQEVGVINVDNIFSKDPNKKVVMKPADYSITPTPKPTDLISYLKEAAGYENNVDFTSAGKELLREDAMGGKSFYDNLGPAQKNKLHEQLSQNGFNRYPNGNDPYAGVRATPGRYSTVQDTYSQDFLDKRTNNTQYATYILEENGNNSLDTQTKVITGATDAVSAGVDNMKQVESEGFGRTSLPDQNITGELPDTERFFQYGPDGKSNLAKFGIERGLVYYTQQIAAGSGPIANAIGRETVEYGTGERNAIVYRGSGPCRNFTMANPLESYGQAIRFAGNGNPESVVGDSVMPRIHPLTKDSGSQNLMFSIENLAYSREDLIGMPKNEQGPNEGRIMWFPPYDLKYSLSHAAKWDTTDLLGRIEPIYTYGGVTRAISISFMLLIDSPPHVMNMRQDEMAQWFWGCLGNPGTPIDTLEPINSQVIITPPAKRKPRPPEEKPDRLTDLPLYYFQNNIHDIQVDYEVKSTKGTATEDKRNLFGLNSASFFPKIEPLLRYIHDKRKSNRKVTIRIEGRCSALFTDLYNANLSYRRAASLKDYILERYQELYNESIVLMNDVHVDNFFSGIDKGNLGKTIVIPSNDGSVEFEITGKGEKFADARSDEKKEINDKYTKQRRLAGVVSCRSEPLKVSFPSIEPPDTPFIAQQRRDTQAERDAAAQESKYASADMVFRNQYTEATKTPIGWENVDYYAPVFHSQTPYDMYKRRMFLQQLMFPGDTKEKTDQIGSNSLFGRMPVCVIRIADELHSKAVINNLTLDMTESTWDTNPEGMGMQAMFLRVTIDANLIGGMALKSPVNSLQTATSFNHIANASFHSEPWYSQERWDYKRANHGDEFRKADSRNTTPKTEKPKTP